MKTKNIIKKGLLLISVATFASCSSFLEEENWTSQSAEDYYKTAKGYESLVNGAYASLKSVYNNYSYHKLTQLGTDIGTQPNGTVTSDLNQYVVTYDKSNGTVYEQWSKLYVALKDVNAAETSAGITFRPSTTNLNTAASPIPENTVDALAPPSSPARSTSAQAVPSG